MWNPQYGTVGPRIGFAYDINGNGKTSLRGGYAIAYERNFGNVTFNVIQNPPNYAVVQVTTPSPITNNNAGPIGGSSGTVPLPRTSLRNVDENIRTAATQFYSLTAERQLANNVIASIAYVGSRGTHLYDVKGYNMLGAGNVYLGDPVQDSSGNFIYSRLNNQYGSINNRGSEGDSYYNGMNLGFQMTDFERTGLIITANYTLARSTDNLSSTFSESNSSVNGVGNLGYLDLSTPASTMVRPTSTSANGSSSRLSIRPNGSKMITALRAGFLEAMSSPASTLSELALHFRSPIAATP